MSIRNYRVGRAVTDTPGDIVTLYGATSATAKYQTLQSAGTAYQVPVGKTLYIVSIVGSMAANTSAVALFYGDDAVNDSAAAPTNGKQLTANIYLAVAFDAEEHFVNASVPTGKYPCILSTGAATQLTVIGFVI